MSCTALTAFAVPLTGWLWLSARVGGGVADKGGGEAAGVRAMGVRDCWAEVEAADEGVDTVTTGD